MKRFIKLKLMKYIQENSNYSDTQLLEIEYGLMGIYLTFSKIFIILLISFFLGIINEVLIFLLIFNVIRMTAFGLHATKSWICLLSSTILFIGIPLISSFIIIDEVFKIILGIISVLFILKNSPADTKKRPIVSKHRRLVLKLFSTFTSIIFVISSLIINNNFISNCLLFSIILEDFLISPLVYRFFNLPYNNYVDFLKSHPNFKC